MVTAGSERGSYFDHEAGEGGDTLGLISHLRPCSVGDAAAWGRSFLGIDGATLLREVPKPAAVEARQAEPEGAAKTTEAVALWHDAAESISGTPAESYLRGRGPDPAKLPLHTGLTGWPPTLRFHAGIGALLIAVNHAERGVIVAVQRILLQQDGTPRRRSNGTKLKLALGPTGGGNAARFAWAPDPHGRWGIAEGAETALAAAQIFGFPVVACLGAANMPKVMPPSWASSAIVIADHDDAGLRAARDAAARLAERGLRVRITRPVQPGSDAADVVASGEVQA